MLGLLGLVGALLASLTVNGGTSDDSTGRREVEDADVDRAEEEAWGVSTAFLDPAPPPDEGGDGIARSDDTPDAPDPDLLLSGTAGDDVLLGRAGQDSLSGTDGQDHLEGAAGDDSLAGGSGDDSLWGDLGDDWLTGEDGNDRLAGCEGDDTADGGAGQDSVLGGTGDDSLAGQAGDDLVDGGEGNDWLSGGDGADALEGSAGNDTLMNGDDDSVDFLNGGQGDDSLHLGTGDYGNGGQGADLFTLQDFAPGAPLVQITDFDPAEDGLVVVYDAALHPDPQLTVNSGGGSTFLLLDGVPLASLTNGAALDLSLVQLQAA